MAFRTKRGFNRRGGSVHLALDETEAGILAGLLGQLGGLVRPEERTTEDPLATMIGIDTDAVVPADPAVLRLFPDAYPDDPKAAEEFRRFTERGLREQKSARVETALMVIERIEPDRRPQATELGDEEAAAFLGALNDLRLVLGSRLGIEHDDQEVGEGWDADDPRQELLLAYQWLTWLQSTLLDSLA